MTEGMYHRLLRVSALVVALLLLFDGGFVAPLTKTLSENTYEYVASGAVGVFAGVTENELNVITAELTERTQALDAREKSLQEREIATRDFGISDTDYSVYVLSLILFVLTMLILMNYFLDWRRSRMIPA